MVASLRSALLIFSAGLSCLVHGQIVHGQDMGDLNRDYAQGAKECARLLPPDVICGPSVKSFQWSDDGLYLAVERTPAVVRATVLQALASSSASRPAPLASVTQVIVYPVRSKKARVVAEVNGANTKVEMAWLRGGPHLMIREVTMLESGLANRVSLFIASSGSTKHLFDTTNGKDFVIEASPKVPEFLVRFTSSLPAMDAPAVMAAGTVSAVSSSTAQSISSPPTPVRAPTMYMYVDRQGKCGMEHSLPAEYSLPEWDDMGNLVTSVGTRVPGKSRVQFTYFRVDPQTWTTAPYGGPVILESHALPAKYFVRRLNIDAHEQGVPASSPLLALYVQESDKKHPAIISADGTDPSLSPNEDAVAFQAQGVLMLREVMKVSLDDYKKARLEAEKADTMAKAKEAGMALLMYANDYDDVWSSNAPGWQEALSPYARSRASLDAFAYTFGGGPSKDIQDPASTVIGYVSSPSGRAVVYADGHVVWIPSP